MRPLRQVAVRVLAAAVLALGIASAARAGGPVFVTGAKHLIVLHVYFHDYPKTARYTQAQVEANMALVGKQWSTYSSYGNVSLSSQVSALYQLPGNRSDYIDTPPDPGGDLSSGNKFSKVLTDAIANAPAGLNWNSVDGVVVVMAETNPANFHRGQGGKCNLPMGPGSSNTPLVGCAIFSENPGSTNVEVWGRWAHEVGHALQAGGPAHPSDYNSNFEQMDAEYPGQTGVFEKQSGVAFGWMPDTKYVDFTPITGGGEVGVYAEEYAPSTKPNAQAVRAYINGPNSAYYLISVRRRVLGDNLDDSFAPPGIPDEGVLIERVTPNTDPWVTVEGKGGDRDALWHAGDEYTSKADGMYIGVVKEFDADDYDVAIRYGDFAHRPDIGMQSWLEPPGNTYETTDIWVDSPVNGYGTYRWGTWPDLLGGVVPKGNGDDPAIGQVNRLYARVRNYGSSTATNIVVHFDVTSPLGLGINGSNGFVQLGTVTSAQFPGLASLAPGKYTDVYVNWTPNANLTPQQLAQGIFYFHSCVRVRMDHLSNETIFGNQDGNGQQENIDYFQAPATGSSLKPAPYQTIINLRNDDGLHAKWFYLGYDRSRVPAGWKVIVNHGVLGLQVAAGAVVQVPAEVVPTSTLPLGAYTRVQVFASSLRLLTNDKHPSDKHPDFQQLGGVNVEGHAVAPSKIACTASPLFVAPGAVIRGTLTIGAPAKRDPAVPVFLEAVNADGRFVPSESSTARVNADGTFSGGVVGGGVKRVICMYAGTATTASSTSGFVSVK
jgi:hypothetical protein